MFRLKTAVIALGLAALAACGSEPKSTTTTLMAPGTLSAAQYRAPGIPTNFGDRSPHDWDGRVPAAYPVHGIDAARYQGVINWRQAAAAGTRFAWLKATEGGDHIDPGYALNSGPARRAGVAVGAYHFYYFCRTPVEQAKWFIDRVDRHSGDLPPVLDIEWNHQSKTCKRRPDAATVRREMRIFLDLVTAHYGTSPVIYTTVDFWADNDLEHLGNYDFWLRSVAGHPSLKYPGTRWVFWQYSGTGIVPGVGGTVDLNAFAGSDAGWRRWFASRAQP
ncbi:glycoside hydrolase [Thioclava sp. SK-1]|uniref:glycoside hydrolase family 25 protein n=1 Tax=Thioclava sp. SK-1 TaxID=1889770 RepID=UPI000825CB14|nr:GH25 family lysozyme [Thioclava sp. SK-1]OCX61039.1 glycoside hydrolase [Thioclava sp. SK-1]